MVKISKDLIKGSLILLIAFNVTNVLNFLFQFSMVRALSVEDYGTLAALFSIIYILTIFTEGIQTILAKYSSKIKDEGAAKNLFKRSLAKSFKVSLFVFAAYLFISILLSRLMDIEYLLLALNGLVVFVSFLIPVGRGVMLGMKKFNSLGANLISESILKIILAIFFVWLGWRVYGAIFAVVLAAIVAFFFLFVSLRKIMKSKEKSFNVGNIYSYSTPVFAITALVTLFYSVDVIIAKIFFSSAIAGYYAIASIIAKTIFWGTQPISRAMFPYSSEHSENKKKTRNFLFNAVIMVLICVVISIIVVLLAPKLLVFIFSGKYIKETADILIYNALAMSFLSFTNLILLYKLSVNRLKRYEYLSVFLVFEIGMLCLFSNNLLTFSMAYAISSLLFLVGTIILLEK